MPSSTSLENPKSNMRRFRERRPAPPSALLLVLDLAFDGGAGRGKLGGLLRRVLAALHAVLEALYRAAEVRADVAQLLGAEDQQHDDEKDDPVDPAHAAHAILLVRRLALFLRDHARKRIRAADDVDMQMIHVLTSDPTRVHDGAEAVGGALLAREPPRFRHHLSQYRGFLVGHHR